MLHSKMVCHRLWQMVLCTSVTTIAPLGYPAAIAQITPDGTLGSESAIVAPTDNVRGLPGTLIRGGARRGVNLFQSFSDFNVGNGQRVYFANPAGVESILSRVTGANPSNILGTLGVDGPANLFLLNPKGILFGPNARLDVAGSFVASTSDRFDFGNGMSFSATNPAAAPLLTMSLRPGLQYGTNYQGDLVNAGNLAVGAGQTLALAGRNVTMTGSLATPGGTVQVLGDRLILRDNASIDVSSAIGGGNVFIGGDLQGQGPLPTASYTYVGPNVTINASTTSPLIPANGGRVIVWSDDTTRFYGTINARGAETGGDGGFVEVSGRQNLVFNGRVDASAPNGRPGTLLLDPTNIEIVAAGTGNGTLADVDDPNDPNRGVNGTQIGVDLINNATANVLLQATNNITFSAPINIPNEGIGLNAQAGNSIFVNSNIFTWGGDVTLAARSGDVTIAGVTIDTNRPFNGVAGDVDISAGRQVSINNSTIDARSNSAAGSPFTTIKISGDDVRINQAYITATNIGTGFAGDIAITARNNVDILNSRNGRLLIQDDGTLLPTLRDGEQILGIFSQGELGVIAIGQSRYFSDSPRNVNISNAQLITNNQSSSASGDVDAGGVFIRAQETISLSNRALITSISNRQGDSGIVRLDTPGAVSLSGDSFISTDVAPVAQGNSLGILIRAGSLEMSGGSAISTSTYAVNGNSSAGDVILTIQGDALLQEGSVIFNNLENSRFGGATGNAGRVLVEAGNLSLYGGSQIQTSVRGDENGRPPASGNAGDVFIQVRDTLRLDGISGDLPSAIFSRVGEGTTGNAGRVEVEARYVRLFNGGSIFSDVLERTTGDGGIVAVTADSVQLRNRGRISVNNFGQNPGNDAGIIAIRARGLWLDRNSFISATTRSGGGGNILLNTLAVILSRTSDISTTAGFSGAGGDGGNIAIGSGNFFFSSVVRPDNTFVIAPAFDQATLLVASNTARNSNILSQAFEGTGGNIRINAFRLQNIAERPDLFTRNDIDTQSFLGVDGTVVVSAINIFPGFRTDPLPDRYEAPRISEGCDPRVRQETSQFTITGRGGLPADPTDVLSPDTLATSGTAPAATAPTPAPSEAITINPARGWVKNTDGSVRLVAHATDPNAPVPAYPLWSTPSSCYAP